MSWGEELWDKYAEASGHTLWGIDFLEQSVANFYRERGKVEAEYAKALRALVKRYMPRESGRPAEEEYTCVTAYKQVGYITRAIFFNVERVGSSIHAVRLKHVAAIFLLRISN
jgi:hypothetical protein